MFDFTHTQKITTVSNGFEATTDLFKNGQFFISRNQGSLIKKINHLKWKCRLKVQSDANC